MLNGFGSKAERLIATTSQERCAHAEWRVFHMASGENLQALAFTPVVVAKLGNIPLLATDQVSIRAELFSRLGFESDFVCGSHRFKIASASRLAHSNSGAHEHPLLADCCFLFDHVDSNPDFRYQRMHAASSSAYETMPEMVNQGQTATAAHCGATRNQQASL